MKRSSYLKHDETIELGKRGLTIWGYNKRKKFVCRVEINAAGLALYSGNKGGKKLVDASWEYLVKRMSE